MARPRRKVSKQKQALKSAKKKNEQSEKQSDLEKLKQLQKERRRRLLWGDEHDHEDYEDDDIENYDEENFKKHGKQENGILETHHATKANPKSTTKHHHGIDDDHDLENECDNSCNNPDCENFAVETYTDFQVTQNSFIVKSTLLDTPPLTISKFDGNVRDCRGEEYGNLTVRRGGKDDLLVTCSYDDLCRVVRDNAIIVEEVVYPAFVCTTGTEGDFYRDYESKYTLNTAKTTSVKPWFSTLESDVAFGLRAEYKSFRNYYQSLEDAIREGRKEMAS